MPEEKAFDAGRARVDAGRGKLCFAEINRKNGKRCADSRKGIYETANFIDNQFFLSNNHTHCQPCIGSGWQ